MRVTTPIFIERAKAIHGDKYDYTNTVYKGNKAKVTITCREHGDFELTARGHIERGRGCKKCSGYVGGDVGLEHFMAKAYKVHGDKYNYDKVHYVNERTKVTITCREHGDFEQAPKNHYAGSGCHECGGYVANNVGGIEHFTKRSIEVHGDKYDYSKVDYVNSDTKVTITCREHGDFEQAPKHHYIGRGCPVCGARWSARRYNNVPTILYYVKVTYKGIIGWKIGITTKSVMERYKADTNRGAIIDVLDEVLFTGGKEAFNAEQDILRKFKSHKHDLGTSLLLDGGTEVFDSDIINGKIFSVGEH